MKTWHSIWIGGSSHCCHSRRQQTGGCPDSNGLRTTTVWMLTPTKHSFQDLLLQHCFPLRQGCWLWERQEYTRRGNGSISGLTFMTSGPATGNLPPPQGGGDGHEAEEKPWITPGSSSNAISCSIFYQGGSSQHILGEDVTQAQVSFSSPTGHILTI